MRSLLKEPLVHFIGLGVLLFAGHALWETHVTKTEKTIRVDPAEIQRQAVIFGAENNRQPDADDVRGLVFAYIEEEALVREAKRLGLDADDTIIRRRLAQKMRFVLEDETLAKAPSEATLKAWYQDNKAEFLQPQRRSFSHVYFSPQNRSDNIEAAAVAILPKLSDSNWKGFGDPFMLERSFTSANQIDITRLFGKDFGEDLFALEGFGVDEGEADEKGQWQGPIGSAFGVHLIRIDDITPATQPDYDSIRPQILRRWQEKTRTTTNQDRLKKLIGSYEIDMRDLAE